MLVLKSDEPWNVEYRNIFTVSIFRTDRIYIQVECTYHCWKQKHKMTESKGELFLENTIQLHYSIEENWNTDADNRNKHSVRHFRKWKKGKPYTYPMQYITFWLVCICSWISRESFIWQQKYLNDSTDNHGTVGKWQTRSLTNHRVAFYPVKCTLVVSLALPLLKSHL